MGALLQDLRYGLRMLAKNAGFTAVAVILLALGMGASTTILSFVHGMLLRPLPYRDPDRLVFVWERMAKFGLERNTPAPGNFVDWKNQNHVFEDMAAFFFYPAFDYTLTGQGEPERLQGAQVTANLFPLLGVQPAAGRNFLPEEDRDGVRKVVPLEQCSLAATLQWRPGDGWACDRAKRNELYSGWSDDSALRLPDSAGGRVDSTGSHRGTDDQPWIALS